MENKIEKNTVLLVAKPYLWTSFDVVNYIRKILVSSSENKKCKVGHAGTLDPLATGLLLICTGDKTKTIDQFIGLDKEYTGIIVLGSTTPSYDLETEIDAQYPTSHISTEMIYQTAKNMTGTFEQMPPIYSAKKVNGEIAYKKARLGENIVLRTATIHIKIFEITAINGLEIHFRVLCSKGTYIRTLAYDFGRALESGAYLKDLCRTKIGDFLLDNALSLSSNNFVNKDMGFKLHKIP